MITMNVQYLMFQRNIHNKSIRELSEDLEIPRQALTSYMNNTFKMINREHLDKLVDYFECSMDELITFSKQLEIADMDLEYDNGEKVEPIEVKSTKLDDLSDYKTTMTLIKHVQKKRKIERDKKMLKELLAELDECAEQEEVFNLFSGSGKSVQTTMQSYLDLVIEKKIKDEFDELLSKLGFESLD